MDANLKIVLDQYFEGASKLQPNVFVPVRANRVIEPLVYAFFSETWRAIFSFIPRPANSATSTTSATSPAKIFTSSTTTRNISAKLKLLSPKIET